LSQLRKWGLELLSNPLHWETGYFVMRIILVIVISKESLEKTPGEGKLNILELGTNPFLDSSHKLSFLLQRFLQARIGSLWEVGGN
jgi:hypothetical protein